METSQQNNTTQVDLSNMNFDPIIRKQAYKIGQLDIPEKEFVSVKGKDKLRDWNGAPGVMPFKPIQESDGPVSLNISESNKDEFLDQVKPIDLESVVYDKPVCLIYNPNSGKKVNHIPNITHRLNQANIEHELMPTQKFGDTYTFARDLDIEKYSIIAVCGGDGSCHEVANGMLARPDGQKLPIAFLPNGSGDDLCNILNIHSMDQALDVLITGNKIKIDTIKVLIDHEDESTITEENRFTAVRHEMINAALSMPCKIANTAVPWKTCCGKQAYTFAAIKEFCKCSFAHELYGVEIDGETIYSNEEPIETIFVMMHNGSSTGAGMIADPFAIINDGLLNVAIITDKKTYNLAGLGGILDKAKTGGTQAYDHHTEYYRGKNMKFTFMGTHTNKNPENHGPQLLGIDGEDLRFNRFVKFETCHENIEVLFDHSTYFTEKKFFD